MQLLFHRCKITRLFLLSHYFHGKCSISSTNSNLYFRDKPYHFHSVESALFSTPSSKCKKKVPLKEFLPKNCYFPERSNLNWFYGRKYTIHSVTSFSQMHHASLSLISRYFHNKCSDSLVPTVQIFTVRANASTELNPSRFKCKKVLL